MAVQISTKISIISPEDERKEGYDSNAATNGKNPLSCFTKKKKHWRVISFVETQITSKTQEEFWSLIGSN